MVLRWLSIAEGILIAVAATVAAAMVWGVFAAAGGLPFAGAIAALFQGGFGSLFAIEQSLRAATPLLLAGLCVALPLQAGLVVIGGEGAIVIGALAAAAAAGAVAPAWSMLALLGAGMLAGAIWIAASAVLKTARGVNEALSGLLLVYVAIAVLNHVIEGPLRDPLSLDKPATAFIPEQATIGSIAESSSLHWGLPVGIVLCMVAAWFASSTTAGLALRFVGGNPRAASYAGIPATAIMLAVAAAAGAAAGLAGAFEIGAVHGRANASLASGYGFIGILVCALARGNMLALIPAAILVGAIEAGSGLLQRHYGAAASTATMMHGLMFLFLLVSESWRGRMPLLVNALRAAR